MVYPYTFCISTYNNLNYLKLAVESVRKHSYYTDAPFIIYAENCDDGTDEWLQEVKDEYGLEIYIEKNEVPVGIGGGMNFCASKVKTEYIMFLHSDFYVTQDWDLYLYRIQANRPNDKLWINSYRIEPDIFGSAKRHGTTLVPLSMFGDTYHNFKMYEFEVWAKEFSKINATYCVPKGEGVSGLVKKSVWDEVGGNDPIFAPASWEDMDLFLRMKQHGVEFVLPGSSVIWHFGARGSHRLEENDGKSSERQIQAEKKNMVKWLEKWKKYPIFDEFGMIAGLQE